MYRVIKRFVDLQDGSHLYEVGEPFPRSGKTVSEARLTELSTANNRQRMPLIEKIEDDPVTEQEPEEAPEPEETPEEAQGEAKEEKEAPEAPKKKGKKK